MKALFGLLISVLVAAPAFSNPHQRIDECNGDSTCIGHVLVDVLLNGRGRPGDSSGSPLVKIYGSTDSCSGKARFEARLGSVSESRCDRLVSTIGNFSVWSIEVQGTCRNISDTDFRNACKSFLAH